MAEARPPQAPTADVLLLQGALRQAHDTSQRLLRQGGRRLQHKHTHRRRDRELGSSADAQSSTTVTADDTVPMPSAAYAIGVCDAPHPRAAHPESRRNRGSRERRARPATAAPSGLSRHPGVTGSLDSSQCRGGVGTDGQRRCAVGCTA